MANFMSSVHSKKVAVLLSSLFFYTKVAFCGTSGFQEYLIPGQESLLRTNYAFIDNDPAVGNAMHCVISVTASTDGTVINYDHWENGYGAPDESYTLNTGQFKIFESSNIPANPRGTTTFYDGGDRITIIGGPAFVSRASWPENPGTVMASAFEILPIQALSNTFNMPVGSDLYQNDRNKPFADFQRVALMIQSTQDNNLITVYNPDNTILWSGTIDKGASVTDASLRNVKKGTRVVAQHAIQIQFLNGLQNSGSSSQINGFTGLPTALWGKRYTAPITSFPSSSSTSSSKTDLYLYNPNTQAITVSYQDSTSGTFTIAAQELASFAQKTGHYVPRNFGVDLNGNGTFWGFGIAGSGYDTWDWGFILMPKEYCRTEYVVGWAPGDLNKTNNYSAVYVMPFGVQSKIYVDYNQDNVVDNTYTASLPQVIRITDPNDRDMTGARIWSPDTLSMSYGEISGSPTAVGSPALDLGYTLLPLAEQFVEQVLSIEKGVNIDTIVVNRPAEFTLKVQAHSRIVGNIQVTDFLPKGWDYVPQSTTISFSNGTTPVKIEPDVSGTVADGLTLLWRLGYTLNVNEFIQINFSIVPTSTAAMGLTENCAEAQGSTDGNIFRPDGCDYIEKVPSASIGDRIWNDADGDGVQDAGETGLENIRLYLYDRTGQIFDSTLTDVSGNYLFSNLIPSSYVVAVDAGSLPDGYHSTTHNVPMTITVAAGENFLTADFGYRATAELGDLIWNDLDRDGIQDAGEPGMEIITIELHRSDGSLVSTTISNSDGYYAFQNLDLGDYYLVFVAPAGYGSSPMDQESDDRIDSDADVATGRTAVFTLSAGDKDTRWDAGFFQLTAKIMLKKYTNGEDADLPTGPSIAVDDMVTWRYLVTNPGDVALTDIVVIDNQAGIHPTYLSGDDGDQLLEFGETWIYEAAAAAVVGQHQNIGTVTAQYNGQTLSSSDPSHYFGGQAAIQIKKYANGVDADEAPGPYIKPGAAVTWSYVIANSGNVAIGSILVLDSHAGITPVYLSGDDGNGLLDVGESWTFEAKGVAEAGQYVNVGTVNGSDIYNRQVSDSDPAHYFGPQPAIDIEKLVMGEDADVPAGPAIPVGQTVQWSYLIKNVGNVPLRQVVVSDDKEVLPQPVDVNPADGYNDGDLNQDHILDLTETWIYAASAVAAAGHYVNIGTATGQYEDQTVSDTDPSHYFGGFASISIKKATNGVDADNPTGPNIIVGNPVHWTYQVSNLGNTAIRDVVITDDQGVTVTSVDNSPSDGINDGDLNGNGVLDPEEIWLYEATGAAQKDQYRNVGHVSGINILSHELVQDEDLSHYYGADPALKIKKYVNGQDADSAPGPTLAPGAALTWQYVVTNTGNVALADIKVIDSDVDITPEYLSGDVDEDGMLDIAEIWIYMAYGSAGLGPYFNLGKAIGHFEEHTIEDDDSSHYFCEWPKGSIGDHVWNDLNRDGLQDADEPGLENVVITLYQSDGTMVASTISNSDGYYRFENIVPADYYLIFSAPSGYGFSPTDQGGDDTLDSDVHPATGRTVTATLSPAEQDDSWDAGLYKLVAAIHLEKMTNGEEADLPIGPSLPVGSTVSWSYQVSNSGDVPVSNVNVTDSQVGLTPVYKSGDDGDELLEPGEIWTYEASGTAVAGPYQNLGTATGRYNGQEITATDLSHYFGGQAGLHLKKLTNGEDANQPPGPSITPGGVVTWRYEIANTGNVVITNLRVMDSEIGVIPVYQSGDDGNGVLDPGEAWLYQTVGTAQSGQYGNMGTVQGTDIYGQLVIDSDPSYYFGPNPAIHLKKLTNGEDADLPTGPAIPVGQAVLWSYIVTNTGNVGLSEVAVSDDQGVTPLMVDRAPADGFNDGDLDLDHVLDLDETWTFTASGVAAAGQYGNTGLVIAEYAGQKVTDQDPSHYYGGFGGIKIKKLTNGQDADTQPGVGIIAGAPIEWLYQIRNTGNTPIHSVSVSDDQGLTPMPIDVAPADGFNDGDTDLDGVLDTEEIWTYLASGAAVEGQYSNIGTATGIDALTGQSLRDQDPSHYFGAVPGIAIEKFTNGEDADQAPGPQVAFGGTIIWRYQVSNTGNVPLHDIVLTDSDESVQPILIFGDLNNDLLLDTNETWIYEATGTAVSAQYQNNSTVSGQYNQTRYEDSDPSHYFCISQMDFGDAMDPSYPTMLVNDGARHILSSLYLGNLIDSEGDGQSSIDDSGDNTNGLNDEDGVHFTNLPFIQNSQNEVVVLSSGSGYLNAWIDFNQDGDWNDNGEHVIRDQPVVAGTQPITFNVPMIDPIASPQTRAMNARFRLSSQTALAPWGLAIDGEVEDYQVPIFVPVELVLFTASVKNSVVELNWTTQSETENIGFYLFRAESENGPFIRLFDQIIPGAGNSTTAHDYHFIDRDTKAGKSYYYRLADVSLHGAIHVHQTVAITLLPEKYELEQNYPNPFNPETTIPFVLEEAGEVTLTIVNLRGQIVRTLVSQQLNAGRHLVKWDARDDNGAVLPSGTYLYLLKTQGFSKSLRMTLLK